MIKSKFGTTIVESLIVMLIIVVGVIGTYSIFTNSQKLSDSTGHRLTAISIAREGIEALINIRDTNWSVFGANTTNCWFTLNYNSACIVANGSSNPYTHIPEGSYKVYRGNDDRWYLSGATTGNYSDSFYKNDFRVNLDNNGFYTQSGGIEFLPLFTREIRITYPPGSGNPPQKAKVESIVRWSDSSRNTGNFEIKLQTVLTNWKKN